MDTEQEPFTIEDCIMVFEQLMDNQIHALDMDAEMKERYHLALITATRKHQCLHQSGLRS